MPPLTPPPLPQLSMTLQTFSAEDPGTWQHLLDRARAYDTAGVDRLCVSDHVVYGENLEAYARPELGGSEGGKQPTGPDGHWLEPVTTLSVVSGITSRVRLSTNILLAALRRPVVLSKSLSTLDVLSGGRLDIGVGVGWQREEYEAAGLDFDGRGRLLDHTLEVLQTMWRETRADYSSPELQFRHIHSMPKPLQPGGVPIWVSGTVNKRVAQRLARFGSGWIPWGPAARDISSGIAQMRDALVEAGRDPEGLQIVGTLPTVKDANGKPDIDRTVEAAPALAAAGVTDVRSAFPLPADASAALDTLRSFVAAFRSAVGRTD
jgi:probable F420-dependent oxidoreductase